MPEKIALKGSLERPGWQTESRRATFGRRRFLRGLGVTAAGVLFTMACRDDRRHPLTTLEGTISLGDDGSLAHLPGEPYVVRTDLAEAQAGRETSRRSLLAFHHFSDFRIVDEESPLRSEWVESCSPTITTDAFRPHETLSLQAAAAMIAEADRIDRSAITGRPVDFALHTGNAADNAQFNELRWFLDLMDGKQVNPDSGRPGYEGVQEHSPADAYDSLLEDAQAAFSPQALRFPWYAVVGNRDLLSQGNFPPDEGARTIAGGSLKVIDVGPEVLDEVCRDPEGLVQTQPHAVLSDSDTVQRSIGADGDRRPLSRSEWIEEHFHTEAVPGPPGHGFSEANRKDGTAYYAVDFGPVSLIVLDSTNPGGFSAGSIDATQFAWLEEQLKARNARHIDRDGKAVATDVQDRVIVIASHHSSAAMNNPFSAPDQGERIRGPQLEELLHRFPNVVLHVAGHGLEHGVIPKADPQRRTSGYWEVSTGSPLEFPMQSRLLEIIDNGDGTMSISSTVYDSAAPINPGDADDPTPEDGVNQLLLASVARQVSARDPQRNPAAGGTAPSDRNAELLLPAPFDLGVPVAPTPTAAANERSSSRGAFRGLR